MNRYKITIEYDGSHYYGWQRQESLKTIQGTIEEAIFKFSGQKTQLFAAGRTDAGVHALGQVAHFDLEVDFPPRKITEAINFYLKKEYAIILDTQIANHDFHARFSAKQRSYNYIILNRNIASPLDRLRVWHIRHQLDTDVMQQACKIIIGHHDFSSFRAAGCQANSALITIDSAQIVIDNDHLYFEIAAKSFLYHMVRNIVGTLVKLGSGKISLDEFREIFHNCDRTKAGMTAPAHGLYFTKVIY
jgi:tRNA pseudouridine38-40 synthase